MEDFEEDMIFIDGEAPTGVFGDDVGNASAFAPVFNSPVIVTSNFEAIPMRGRAPLLRAGNNSFHWWAARPSRKAKSTKKLKRSNNKVSLSYGSKAYLLVGNVFRVHNLSTPSSLNKELLEEAIKVMEMVKSLGSEFNAPDVELEKGVGDSC
ncbi:hypothetical protein V6N12_050164 [Hibiscus sabdariffa]|uniref:Uncharacterized protein n=1 Tax=Hibiscus sabdariffa TaxID=183260 RepID=A0ABR2GBL3_9ROSI